MAGSGALWSGLFHRHEISNQFQVFNITCTALLVKKWSPDLKIDTSKYLFWNIFMTHACEMRASLTDSLANLISGLGAISLYLHMGPADAQWQHRKYSCIVRTANKLSRIH